MLKLIYQQNNFPIFQNRMYESAQAGKNCTKGDIRLVQDTTTGLVFNDAFRPELMIYDAAYQNEQGLSTYFRRHLDLVANIVERHLGKECIVEIGCGKGFFLELLFNRGVDISGFDVTYEGENPRVHRQYFGPGVIERAEGLVLRHVLEHIQNPYNFLEMLCEANDRSGRIYIEVPCFDWICEHRAWFDIFYEHVNYFRLSDFHRMFDQIIDSGRVFGGQYIYIVAELNSLRKPVYIPSCDVNLPVDFGLKINSKIDIDARSAVWGAASKGVIYTLLQARRGVEIDLVIDINPAKQGKFMAGTGIQVQSPVNAMQLLPTGSNIFVMNSNYLDEIKQISESRYNYIGVDHE